MREQSGLRGVDKNEMDEVRRSIDELIDAMKDLATLRYFDANILRSVYEQVETNPPLVFPNFEPKNRTTWGYLFSFKEQAHKWLIRGNAITRHGIDFDRIEFIRKALQAIGRAYPDLGLTGNLVEFSSEQKSWVTFLKSATEITKRRSTALRLEQSGVSHVEDTPPTVSGAGLRNMFFPTPPTRCLGREEDTDKIIQHLTETDGAKRIIVYGGPGYGKTTVTREVASHEMIKRIYGARIYFIELEHVSDYRKFATSIANAVNCLNAEANLREILESIANVPSLLILDNLETPLEADKTAVEQTIIAFNEFPTVSLMASLRGRELPIAVRWSLRLEILPLDEPAAQALFLDVAPEVSQDDPHLHSLLIELAGIPLAIELIALEASYFGDLEPVWNEWLRLGTEVAQRNGVPADRLSSLEYSLDLSLSSAHRDPQARRMLAVIAELSNGADIDLLRRIFGDSLYRCSSDLLRSGIVFRRGYRFDVLPPIRTYLRKRTAISEIELAEILDYFSRTMAFLNDHSDQLEKNKVQRLLSLEALNIEAFLPYAIFRKPEAFIVEFVRNFLKVMEALLAYPTWIEPDVGLSMSRRLNGIITDVALHARSQENWEIELHCIILGHATREAEVAWHSRLLTTVLARIDEAAENVETSLRLRLKAFTEENRIEHDKIVSGSSGSIAGALQEGEQLFDAFMRELNSGEMTREEFANVHLPQFRNVSLSRAEQEALGKPYIDGTVQFKESTEYDRYVQCRDVEFGIDSIINLVDPDIITVENSQKNIINQYESVFGSVSWQVAKAKAELAYIYSWHDRLLDALSLVESASLIAEGVLGPEAELTLWIKYQRGVVYAKLGRQFDALELLSTVTESNRKLAGTKSSWFAEAAQALGTVYQNLGDFEKSESLLREALIAYEHCVGDQSIEVGDIVELLAAGYCEECRFSDAEKALFRARSIYEQRNDHPRLRDLGNRYASLLIDIGKYAEAETHFKNITDRQRTAGISDKQEFSYYLSRLGDICIDTERHAEAYQYYLEAFHAYDKPAGEQSFFAASLQVRLGRATLKLGKIEKSMRHFETATPEYLRIRHGSALMKRFKAEAYLLSGTVEQAELLALEAVSEFRESPNCYLMSLARCLTMLGEVYRKKEDFELAKSYAEEAAEICLRTRVSNQHVVARSTSRLLEQLP